MESESKADPFPGGLYPTVPARLSQSPDREEVRTGSPFGHLAGRASPADRDRSPREGHMAAGSAQCRPPSTPASAGPGGCRDQELAQPPAKGRGDLAAVAPPGGGGPSRGGGPAEGPRFLSHRGHGATSPPAGGARRQRLAARRGPARRLRRWLSHLLLPPHQLPLGGTEG